MPVLFLLGKRRAVDTVALPTSTMQDCLAHSRPSSDSIHSSHYRSIVKSSRTDSAMGRSLATEKRKLAQRVRNFWTVAIHDACSARRLARPLRRSATKRYFCPPTLLVILIRCLNSKFAGSFQTGTCVGVDTSFTNTDGESAEVGPTAVS